MTEKQKERVAALLAAAEKCEEAGIRVGLDNGAGYRIMLVKNLELRECKTVEDLREALADEETTLYVSDGERLWREPRMVLELDVFSPYIVTRKYYFKNIKKTWGINAFYGASIYNVPPERLPQIMDPAEVVIYDHTRQEKGRAAREVLE